MHARTHAHQLMYPPEGSTRSWALSSTGRPLYCSRKADQGMVVVVTESAACVCMYVCMDTCVYVHVCVAATQDGEGRE
jgi:hypothetical protein